MARERIASGTSPQPTTWPTTAAVIVMIALFFALDLLLPTGVASGVPYILPVLVSLRLPSRAAPLVVAGVVTVLTVLGFFLPLPHSSDEAFWLGFDNRVIAVLAIWTTAILGYLFTARDRAVHERELRLRTVVEATPDLIVTLDSDGRVESCNAAAARTFGRTGDGAIGHALVELLGPPVPCADGTLPPDATELLGEGGAGSGLSSVRRGDEIRTVRWVVRPLDAEGRRLAVGHDLTELLDAQERAVRSERLAAIGQTLATLSHESKNELLAIRFGLEQLGSCWDDRDATVQLIGGLLDSQDRLWRMFEDLRGYAAPIRLRPGRIALSKVWRRAWDSLEPHRAERDVQLVERATTGETDCTVDAFRLEQVFRNLFENAIAACPDPVRVAVTCSEGTWRGEPALFVSVRDNGPGLPEEVRPRMFEPFFTTKPQGTGLGLPLCRRILEVHHGELSVGPPGDGAELVLTLPKHALAVPADPVEV